MTVQLFHHENDLSDPGIAMRDPLASAHDGEILALAIVNTLPEPFLVLDDKLRVLAASRAFCDIFRVGVEDTQGQSLFMLGDGQWNIPALRHLLETIIPDRAAMDGFEVTHDFPGVGLRTMLLNARKVVYKDSSAITILLAFRDVSAARQIEGEKAALLARMEHLVEQKRVLLEEMRHRIANSLQIIGSILMLKARAGASEETRIHLKDAHLRVMSVAMVQHHLNADDSILRIDVGPYLSKLCAGLSASVIGDDRAIAIEVRAESGTMESATAVSLGLIVTELVINAIKYAFPGREPDAQVLVAYQQNGDDWQLTVSDNGSGYDVMAHAPAGTGLGTTIVMALAKQLGAGVEIISQSTGLRTRVTTPNFLSAPDANSLANSNKDIAGS